MEKGELSSIFQREREDRLFDEAVRICQAAIKMHGPQNFTVRSFMNAADGRTLGPGTFAFKYQQQHKTKIWFERVLQMLGYTKDEFGFWRYQNIKEHTDSENA